MSRGRIGLVVVAVALAATAAPLPAAGQESPHEMMLPDGSVDEGKCGFCHDDDLSLARPHVETCTLCHAPARHSGSLEHLRASAVEVERALRGRKANEPPLPLTDDKRIYCGTCHLFHDPKAMSEPLLPEGRAPSDSALNRAVRDAIAERLEHQGPAAAKSSFNSTGTRFLRLPNADGTLCRQCHGEM